MRTGLVLLLSACLAFVGPAAVAESRIGLSRDGITWANSLPGSLFDPTLRWVPGDSRVASFYVRNQAESGASLRVDVTSADTDALLDDHNIRLDARAAGSAWTPLQHNEIAETLTSTAIGVGDAVRVDLRAVFDAASTNQSQAKSVALRFVVTLADALGGGSPGGGAPDPGQGGPGAPGFLPATGSSLQPWMLWMAAAMVGTGFALVSGRREAEVDV